MDFGTDFALCYWTENGENMSRSITIDDISYSWDELSTEVKNSLGIIEICRNKITDLENTLTFLRKARDCYVDELRLENDGLEKTLSFGID